MKKLLLTALCLTMIPVAAYAGYSISNNIHGETEETVSSIDTLVNIPVFDLDADDDGTEDNADTDSHGSVDYVNAAAFGLVFEDLTAASTLTTADCGKTFFLNSATEFATTLPSPTSQCRFLFYVKAAPASASYTVVTASSANIIAGGINELETDTGDDGPSVTAGDTITVTDGVAVQGDHFELHSDGTSWYLRGQAAADGGVVPSQAS